MIEVLSVGSCPHVEPTLRLIREVVSEMALASEIREIRIETQEEATEHRFLGSPTVRVDGTDIEPGAEARRDFSLSCRIYEEGGVPSKRLLRDALREAS